MNFAFFRIGTVLLVLVSTACRASTKETPPPPDAGGPVTAVSAAPNSLSAAIPVAPAREPELEEPVRAADAGPVKLRRLVKIDGGAAAAAPEALVAAAAAEPAVDSAKRRKPNAGSMSDEAPYGGEPAATGAAVLKKTPLPSDDPWAKAPTR